MRDAVGDEGRLGDGERGAGAMEVAVARLERVEDVPGESQVALEFLAGGEPVAGLEGASLEIRASSRQWDFSFRDDARAPASGVQTSVKTDAAREPVERERRGIASRLREDVQGRDAVLPGCHVVDVTHRHNDGTAPRAHLRSMATPRGYDEAIEVASRARVPLDAPDPLRPRISRPIVRCDAE